jgi:hypothetical protein
VSRLRWHDFDYPLLYMRSKRLLRSSIGRSNETPAEDAISDPQEQSFELLLSGILLPSRQIRQGFRMLCGFFRVVLHFRLSGCPAFGWASQRTVAVPQRMYSQSRRAMRRSRGSRGGRRSACNMTSSSFIQATDSFSGNGSLSCLMPLLRCVLISI